MNQITVVAKINSAANAKLLSGYRIFVTGEEETFHLYSTSVPLHSQPGIDIGYGRKRQTSIRKGTYATTISMCSAERLLMFLGLDGDGDGDGGEFNCRDEDGEQLTVSVIEPSSFKRRDTVIDSDGNRQPLAFVDYERQGERYGLLTIMYRCGVQNGRRQFFARCDCGGDKSVSLIGLQNGDNLSCGCRRGQNQAKPLLAGQIFNALTVIKLAERPLTSHKSGFVNALAAMRR